MQKFTKHDTNRRDRIMALLNKQHAELATAALAYNALVDTYNETMEEARGFVTDCVSSIEEYMNNRSDAWNESDRAEEMESWKSEFEDAENELTDHEHFETLDDESPAVAILENLRDSC